MTIVLFSLSACFSIGGRIDPSPTIVLIDEAVEDIESEQTELEYVPSGPTLITELEPIPEPTTDPELGVDPVVDWKTQQSIQETIEEAQTVRPQLRPKPVVKQVAKPDPTVRASHYQMPDNRTYTGQVIGTINPSYSHLSDPRIELTYDTGLNSMRASVSYEDNGVREVLDRYGGVRISADGSFRFSKGLSKFDGTLIGDNKVVVGNVSTPKVHGTFVAKVTE